MPGGTGSQSPCCVGRCYRATILAHRAPGVGKRMGPIPVGVDSCPKMRTPPAAVEADGGVHDKAGGDVLSHRVASAVPSAQRGLTAVFGMGTGVTLSLSHQPIRVQRIPTG